MQDELEKHDIHDLTIHRDSNILTKIVVGPGAGRSPILHILFDVRRVIIYPTNINHFLVRYQV